jgi:hypothetical protein
VASKDTLTRTPSPPAKADRPFALRCVLTRLHAARIFDRYEGKSSLAGVTGMSDKRAVYVSLVLERNGDGYLASVPGLQGAFAEGDTVEESIFNCIDVVKMISAYRAERGESLGFNEVKLTQGMRMTVSVPVGVG